jgi:hypothetical protein
VESRNVWLLTLDNLLPCLLSAPQPDGTVRPVAVTLDALLQWISPVTVYDVGEEAQFAAIFSDAIKYMILPQEKVFGLDDFAILAEMERDSKLMPLEDIEGALRVIQSEGATLDLTTAGDREKMSYKLSRFVKGTGRKFKEELAQRAAETAEAKEQGRLALEAAEERRSAEIGRLQMDQQAQIEALSAAHEGSQLEWERQLNELRCELDAMGRQRAAERKATEEGNLRRIAYVRFFVAVALLIAIEAGCVYGSLKFGRPVSDFEKLKDSLGLFGVAFGVWVVFAALIMGSLERMSMLSWPLRRILGADKKRE